MTPLQILGILIAIVLLSPGWYLAFLFAARYQKVVQREQDTVQKLRDATQKLRQEMREEVQQSLLHERTKEIVSGRPTQQVERPIRSYLKQRGKKVSV